jgi:hypothetical protein
VKSAPAHANRMQVAQTMRPQQKRPANLVRPSQGQATYASQQQSHNTQMRMASRPTTSSNTNGTTQSRPILW